jgi:hypothetical protein
MCTAVRGCSAAAAGPAVRRPRVGGGGRGSTCTCVLLFGGWALVCEPLELKQGPAVHHVVLDQPGACCQGVQYMYCHMELAGGCVQKRHRVPRSQVNISNRNTLSQPSQAALRSGPMAAGCKAWTVWVLCGRCAPVSCSFTCHLCAQVPGDVHAH